MEFKMKSILYAVFLYILFNNAVYSQWSQVYQGPTDSRVEAMLVNGNSIFAGFYNYPNASIGVLKSTNNGYNWYQTSLNFQKVICLAAKGNNIFAGTQNFGVYVSSNNGTDWIQTTLNSVSVHSLASNGTSLFAGTVDSGLYKSTNNGDSWIRTTLPLTKSTGALLCNGTDMFAGAYWCSYKSTNNGNTWSPMSLDNVAVQCFGISGSKLFSGFVYGSTQYAFYSSTDNGLTWNSSGNLGHVLSIITSGVNNVIAGNAYVSTDNGLTWVDKGQGMTELVFSLCVTNNYIYAGTSGGRIYCRPLSEVIGIQQISSEVPKKYLLNQNYPNPFNPVTNITFDIAAKDKVRLIIFDALGREVIKLVNQELQPGCYQADWNAIGYSSGIYFYRLETKDYLVTKKMILLK
ncbi:MAG: T9SS C-terminal target domain-containing protein [Ignavibacteriae bacterium]|nr:MAG: T9SS C-terminal target domain-containing protein [Ignavibacteriota bacterium]